MQLSIKTDFKDVQRSLASLSDDLQRRVVPAAINRVAAKANTEMVRAITSEFNIKATDVRGKLRVKKAERKMAGWFATLYPSSSSRRDGSLNLIRFIKGSTARVMAKRGKRGGPQLQFQIKKSAGRQQITGAFIGNQGRTVFVRVGDQRTPIKALSTIGVSQMFNTRRINARVVDRIRREMPVEFDRAINAAIKGAFR